MTWAKGTRASHPEIFGGSQAQVDEEQPVTPAAPFHFVPESDFVGKRPPKKLTSRQRNRKHWRVVSIPEGCKAMEVQ